jgi:hypothetical protein
MAEEEERPTTIPYRWTAQDAEKPAKIANPYGINPGEVFETTGKAPPNDKRWASVFADGDVVNLPVSKCRISKMLEQFFVPGYTWQEVPPDLQASTIDELCQKLVQRSDKFAIYGDFSAKAPSPTTPEATRTAFERKNALAKKLFWYWKNTDYRWALLHSGVSLTTVNLAPETLATQATAVRPGSSEQVTGRLAWVLARATSMEPLRVKPHAAPRSVPSPTTLRLPSKPVWNADPQPGTPFADLPEDFRETVKRSFVDRMCAVPGTSLNLDNAFWGDPQQTTAWDALQRFGPQDVNLLVRLYRRIEAIDPTMKLWRQLKYIRNEWSGGSAGVTVVYHKPSAMRACLDGLFSATVTPSVARDRFFYALEHQRPSSVDLALEALDDNAELPDCDTWREVDKPRQEACHFCVGKSDLRGHMVTPEIRRDEFFEADLVEPRHAASDSIHIDWFSPVDGVDPTARKCNYLDVLDGSGRHWMQATMGFNTPTFHFNRIRDKIAALLAPAVAARFGGRIESFVTRWEGAKWKLAVRGKAGDNDALAYSAELDSITSELDPSRTPAH